MARPPATHEERELRKQKLLDAAVSLWQQNQQRVPSVAEVACAAGVAKGTVYLYFKSKEDLLLAVHQRHMQVFFNALIKRASQSKLMDFDDMMGLIRKHITRVAAFLPLATLVAGLRHKGVSTEVGEAFDQQTAAWLCNAGNLLCKHFPLTHTNNGVRLLMRSYALILGLWQLIGSDQPICISRDVSAMLLPDYLSELDAALRALWHGDLNKEFPLHA